MSKGVEKTVSFTIVVLVLKHVATMSSPSWLWNFIIEETRGCTFTELLKTEPLQDIWFLTITGKLHWSQLSVHIVNHILPCLLRVEIKFPSTISVFSLSPVWNGETLIDSPWSSVECNVADAFKKGVWVEILRIHMHEYIWLLVEFDRVQVLDPKTCIIIIN